MNNSDFRTLKIITSTINSSIVLGVVIVSIFNGIQATFIGTLGLIALIAINGLSVAEYIAVRDALFQTGSSGRES